jgi:ribosomal protein S12 methylthiotransferase accessory factor
VALLRALTECNQAILVAELSGPGSQRRDLDARGAQADAVFRAGDLPYLRPHDSEPPRRAGDYPCLAGDDIRDDIRTCVEIAGRAGLETLVLEQTRPDVGMPAVKVVVPGLRHFWPRFAPGRLYDAPLALGWVTEAFREEDLNPEPFPG